MIHSWGRTHRQNSDQEMELDKTHLKWSFDTGLANRIAFVEHNAGEKLMEWKW